MVTVSIGRACLLFIYLFFIYFLNRKQYLETDILKAFHIKFHVIVIDQSLRFLFFANKDGEQLWLLSDRNIIKSWQPELTFIACAGVSGSPLSTSLWCLMKCETLHNVSSLHND